MNNKMMMEIKREILVSIEGIEELSKAKGIEYPVVEPNDENGYNKGMIINATVELVNDGLVTDNQMGVKSSGCNIENRMLFLTENGNQLAEHWSNDDRWNETMRICGELRDFSTRVVHMVYDELLKSDLLKHISECTTVDAINNIGCVLSQIDRHNMSMMKRN